jgi:phosphoribosylanthranilate isomerase
VVTIKICGLCDTVGLDAALSARADMVGFVFFERSPRNLSFEKARALGAQVAGRAKKVALVVDADDAAIAAIIGALQPDVLQMHGHESPERVSAVRARFGLPVMRAIPIAGRHDLAGIARYEAVADYLLFDAKASPEASRPGGNAESFDWALLDGIKLAKPWLLAGGINVGNLAKAMTMSGARGLDVSSGVESMAGVKDPTEIQRFVTTARAAGETLGSAAPIR